MMTFKRLAKAGAFLVVVALVTALGGLSVAVRAQEPPGWGGVVLKSHRVEVRIENQIAVTRIEQVFKNEGGGLAEGTYLFPLPEDAAVSDLTLWINGQPVSAQILDADQAQNIYTEIVRRMRDPVLLQYVGRRAVQANIFPIPAGEERKIEITYSHVLTAENNVLRYTYPLNADYASRLPAQEVSVSVEIVSEQPIRTVYSPNPQVGIFRDGDHRVQAGFETSNYRSTDDFDLYYSIETGEIDASLITYRGSANEDGFFMLMLTPPQRVARERVIPRDVYIVLDQSGSMGGAKWDQARAAAQYVLKNLNPEDRFNAIVFSTGYRIYANDLQPVSEARNAVDWIGGLEALGGTDIHAALTAALQSADPARQTVVLFLTDGLPTEGVTNPDEILKTVDRLANERTRLFVFGVGNDVDTFLLDSLSSRHGGVSVYVRPEENIESAVSTLYSRITSPVLTALELEFDGVRVDDVYPAAPLPDLFAGQQLIVAGRFRDGGTGTVTLRGQADGETRTYTFERLRFPDNAGGQPFVPRLWATRKIGALLNQIRLQGENQELVDSVVKLSVRYGIITPYTSYLIQEDDIWAQVPPGEMPMPVEPIVRQDADAGRFGAATSGEGAVNEARESNALAGADQAAALPTMLPTMTAGAPSSTVKSLPGSAQPGETIRQVGDRTFVLRDGFWVDTQYTSDDMPSQDIEFLSQAYFDLLAAHPEIAEALALGERVVVVVDGVAYLIQPA